MASPRKSTARMSTGGKPPKKPLAVDRMSEDDNDDDHLPRPRRMAKPSAKKLASFEDQDLEDEPFNKHPTSEDEEECSEVEFVEDPPPTPATPVRKAKPSTRKKALEQEEESPPPTKKVAPKSKKKNITPEMVDTDDDDPDGVAAPLAKDDNMYPEKSRSKIQPFEPGISRKNQNSARRGRDPDSPSPNPSPSKKKRIVVSDVGLSPSKDKGKGKVKAVNDKIGSDVMDEDQEQLNISDDHEATVESSTKTSLAALDGLSFNDVFTTPKDVTSSEDKATVYMEDLVPKVAAKPIFVLPEVCEVTEPGLQDPFLLKSGFYKELVNLPGGRNKNPQYYMLPMFPSSKFEGGRPNFEGWKIMCPDMDIGMAIRPLIFQQSGRFINPSRIDPHILGIEPVFSNERYELTVKGSTAICLSSVMVINSFLRNVDSVGQSNLANKYHFLRAKYMAYEFERASALFTLLLGKGQLYAQIKGDANEFQTKSAVDSSKSNNNAQAPQPVLEEESEEYSVPGFMNTQSTSPSKQRTCPPPTPLSSENKPLKVRGLAFEDTVPIYDGRSQTFDYNDLAKLDGKLDKIFPQYPAEEEIPPCSYAVVAYVSQYSSYKDRVKNEDGRYVAGDEVRWKFTPFIQWVIVVGMSKKNIRGYVK